MLLQLLQTFSGFANFCVFCKNAAHLAHGYKKNGVDLGGSWSTPFSEEGSALKEAETH